MGSFSSDVSGEANSADLSSGASTEILIAGSTTVQPVSELMAKQYMEDNNGVKVTVQAGGSSAGIASAGMGVVDIGAASKFVSDEDQAKFPDLNTHTIGGSAVVVITNADNPANATAAGVTQAGLEAIYDDDASTVNATEYVNDIVVFHRAEGSGTEETFGKYVNTDGTKNVDAAVANTVAGSLSTVDTATGNQGVLEEVASTDYAIGFVDFGFADGDDRVIILDVDGFEATSSNVKSAVKDRLADEGSSDDYQYDLCRPLNYLVNGEPSSVVNDYLTFAKSPAALDFFHECGYYGITELQ